MPAAPDNDPRAPRTRAEGLGEAGADGGGGGTAHGAIPTTGEDTTHDPTPTAIPAAPPAPSPWREPAAALPLRWGAYRPRLVAGTGLLVAGVGFVLGTTAYTLPLLLAGSLLQAAAWAVLPSTIGRRVAVALPVLGFSWLLLGGSRFAWCYAVVLAAWLLVRLRPLIAYAVLALPVAASMVLGRVVSTYEEGWVTILTMTLVVVGSAWGARGIAAAADSWQAVRPLRKRQDRFEGQEPLTGPDPKRGMHGTHQSGLLEQPGVPEQRPNRDGRDSER